MVFYEFSTEQVLQYEWHATVGLVIHIDGSAIVCSSVFRFSNVQQIRIREQPYSDCLGFCIIEFRETGSEVLPIPEAS